MKKIPIILDGDPGHDDAIAWMLANASPLLDIRAVTSVCGNQTIEKTTYNALRIMTLIGLRAPMARGRTGPLVSEPIVAPTVHGKSGLDGPDLPEPAFEPLEMSAVELMAKVLSESAEPVTLVPTGPLTNVAALLLAHPELKSKIREISLMGGGIHHGNWTPAAEFNILVDPEAADLVFRSGIPIIMAGLDVTEQALVFPEDFERIRALGQPRRDGGRRMARLLLRLPPRQGLSRRAGARRGGSRRPDRARDSHDRGAVRRGGDAGRLLPRRDRRRLLPPARP